MTKAPTRMHSLERASPEGEGMPFIGTCTLCGKPGLTIADMATECENVRGLDEDDALIEAVERTVEEPKP